MAKLACVFIFFIIVYGRMIWSTLSDDSGFSRKKSATITNTTISGTMDGKFFDDEVLPPLKEVM